MGRTQKRNRRKTNPYKNEKEIYRSQAENQHCEKDRKISQGSKEIPKEIKMNKIK